MTKKNLVEEYVRNMVDLKDYAEYLEEKSVKFTVALDNYDAKRLEFVCDQLGQKRAPFAAEMIMKVVEVFEEELVQDKESHFNMLMESIKKEKEVESN